MSHIYIVFLKFLEFRQILKHQVLGLYICSQIYPLTHTLLAQKQSKHTKQKFGFEAPFWCTNSRGSMQVVRKLQWKAPVQGYCIKVQWLLNVTWAPGLSTGQTFHEVFCVKWGTFQCTLTLSLLPSGEGCRARGCIHLHYIQIHVLNYRHYILGMLLC